MRKLHGNQKKILDYLLTLPDGATLEELSAHLQITKSAAKEHVVKIQDLGLLSFVDSRGFIGRPKRRYMLSPNGHEAFPKQYSWLSTIMLELLADNLGEEGVSQLMTDLADKVFSSMAPKFRATKNTAELMTLITATLNELGYRSSLRQSDLRKGAVIEATNCVYHDVAKKHPELCGFDVRFIENATGGMRVNLESCIAKGGTVCRFGIRRK